MKTVEILTATQFVDALKKEQGIDVAAKDVKIGRLDVNDGTNKETGYVCFYAIVGERICWLKAFKGTTERVTKVGVLDDEVKIVKEYCPVCFFKSAYKNTTWKVNTGEEGIFLTVGKK